MFYNDNEQTEAISEISERSAPTLLAHPTGLFSGVTLTRYCTRFVSFKPKRQVLEFSVVCFFLRFPPNI